MTKKTATLAVLTVCLLSVGAGARPFVRGDANGDGRHDLADAIVIFGYLFSDMPVGCEDALDANDDGMITISDAVKLARYLFGLSGDPAAPFPACGEDPTDDALACAAFSETTCPTEPPLCLTAENLQSVVDLAGGVPLCLPSPLFQTELLGAQLVFCPTGCCTCASGASGCEATIEAGSVTLDIDQGLISFGYGGTAHIPVDVGTTRCDATFTFQGALSLVTTFGDTSWDGVYEIAGITDIAFTVDDIAVETTGGIVCLGLQLAAPLFGDLLSETIDTYADELFALIPEQLEGLYVCPAE